MKRSYLLPLFMAVGSFVSAPLASAALVTFNDRPTWFAAASGVTTIDFEGLAAPEGYYPTVATPGGITISSVHFEGHNILNPLIVNNDLYVVDSQYHANPAPFPQFPYDRGTGDNMQGPTSDARFGGTPGDGILITLPGAGKTAVGADFWAFYFEKTLVPTATFEVTYYNGATNLGIRTFDTLSYPSVKFFGVTSDTLITQVFVRSLGGSFDPSSWVELDNFSTGTATAVGPTDGVPEPSTFVLISGALAGLWFQRRRA